MVEQGTHKPLVTGSNPVSATNDRLQRPGRLPGRLRIRRRCDVRRAGRRRGPSTRVPDSPGQPNIRPTPAVLSCEGVARFATLWLGPTLEGGSESRTVPRAYTAAADRAPTDRQIRRLRYTLNTRFMRNGIVMLVLVAATAALLYALIQPAQPSPKSYSQFEQDVKAGRVTTDRPPGHHPDRHPERLQQDRPTRSSRTRPSRVSGPSSRRGVRTRGNDDRLHGQQAAGHRLDRADR